MRTEIGQFSEQRAAWLTTHKFECIIFIGDDEDWKKEKEVQISHIRVKTQFRQVGRRYPFVINLTNMTLNELEEFEKCMKFAIEQARPICTDLDQKAREAWEAGDDSWSRMYRPDVKFLIRGANGYPTDSELSGSPRDERTEQQQSQGIQSGPDGGAGVHADQPTERLLGRGSGDDSADEDADGASPFPFAP